MKVMNDRIRFNMQSSLENEANEKRREKESEKDSEESTIEAREAEEGTSISTSSSNTNESCSGNLGLYRFAVKQRRRTRMVKVPVPKLKEDSRKRSKFMSKRKVESQSVSGSREAISQSNSLSPSILQSNSLSPSIFDFQSTKSTTYNNQQPLSFSMDRHNHFTVGNGVQHNNFSHNHSSPFNSGPIAKDYYSGASHPQGNFSSSVSGRRCIELCMEEEGRRSTGLAVKDFFKSFRKKSFSVDYAVSKKFLPKEEETFEFVKVSWYEGTTTKELQDYVRRAISRKLDKDNVDYRILDMNRTEEIILTPYIPNGSKFMVIYSFLPPIRTVYDYSSKAPYSPSRAPSTQITPNNSSLHIPDLDLGSSVISSKNENVSISKIITNEHDTKERQTHSSEHGPEASLLPPVVNNVVVKYPTPFQQGKHVIFVISNYFIYFISMIAVCAEIYERSPKWTEWIQNNLEHVNSCSADRDSLFECVSNGDISGLLASFIIWITSKTTRRFFLFGFDSVQILWKNVYEALVSSVCWCFSYMFIRRGLNPDTRTNFLQKYFKDCAYGGLAVFNAAFLKAVLKNLIPKEAVSGAFEEAFMNNKRLGFIERIFKVLLPPDTTSAV